MSEPLEDLNKLCEQVPGDSPLIEVRGSRVHGRGLFATRDIPKDTYVIEYVGERIGKEESQRRGLELYAESEKTGGAAVYIFTLNDEFDLDGGHPDNKARLINHSCDPNCEAQQCEEDRLWIVALKGIREGEELTFNYGFDLDTYRDHPCCCGTERCVGYILAEDYWPQIER
jgi:SET domain-containing protein